MSFGVVIGIHAHDSKRPVKVDVHRGGRNALDRPAGLQHDGGAKLRSFLPAFEYKSHGLRLKIPDFNHELIEVLFPASRDCLEQALAENCVSAVDSEIWAHSAEQRRNCVGYT